MIINRFIVALAILLPAVANAHVIKQRPFSYSNDVANATESDVFVVCANSPDDRLSVLSAPPQLAIRMSRNETPMATPKTEVMPATEPRKICVACLLGTVHFPLDSAVLIPEERTNLDTMFLNLPADAVVNLDGYTCDLGSDAHNMSLSLQRAEEVASYLRGKNVHVRSIKGKGKCCPVSDDRRLNRRVELTTQKREEK